LFCFVFSSITKWKENGDWSAGDNCIPSAKYRVKVAGDFVLPHNRALSRSTRGTHFQVVSKARGQTLTKRNLKSEA